MEAAAFAGSFLPIVQCEKWEIHPVFRHFPHFRLKQNLSPKALAPLCGIALEKIPVLYSSVKLDKYVVMPNHIHGIFVMESEKQEESSTNICTIVGQYKMSVTKKIRMREPKKQVWQRSFYDHIIRNRESYEKIWNYIEDNPRKWEED